MLEDRVSINRVSINIEGVYSADLCEFIRKYSVWTSRFLGKLFKNISLYRIQIYNRLIQTTPKIVEILSVTLLVKCSVIVYMNKSFKKYLLIDISTNGRVNQNEVYREYKCCLANPMACRRHMLDRDGTC